MSGEGGHVPGWTVDTLKAYIDQRFADWDKALVLQAEKYESRLGELNHAHERAQETAHTYVTLQKYEDSKVAEALARELALQTSDARISSLESWRAKAIGAMAVLVPLSGLVGAAIVKALTG